MAEIDVLAHRILDLRARGRRITLLAVCPNSDAVLEAAVLAAASNHAPMLLAATLNQVDRDGGYTGWTPQAFVARLRELADAHRCASPLYPCLDHGGPWLKDLHTSQGLALQQTMNEVRASITACLESGYALLHIDPTVDRSLPRGQPPPVRVVIERTIELIRHSEQECLRLGRTPVSYEVGTEEVHGGLADLDTFDEFVAGLQTGLRAEALERAWPCFIVGKVGTDLHTTTFDAEAARILSDRLAPYGSLVKGHYTDWVENPAEYPLAGMGGANLGPELTAAELAALRELCALERRLASGARGFVLSRFEAALESAVVDSRRWQKWLQPDEVDRSFAALSAARREWLVATDARYVWTDPRVHEARLALYRNVQPQVPDPHAQVLDRIGRVLDRYVEAFQLRDSQALLSG